MVTRDQMQATEPPALAAGVNVGCESERGQRGSWIWARAFWLMMVLFTEKETTEEDSFQA